MVDAATIGATRMRKRLIAALLISAIAALFLATAAPAGATVLYEQMNSATGLGITSQQFEASHEQFTSQLADDFVVPAGETWNINEVSFKGSYSSTGTAESFNVFFYNNGAGNLPSSIVAIRAGLPYTEVSGEFTTSFSNPVGLKAGTYWVSIQANQHLETAGQWFWVEQSVQSNQEAVWQNPGGGFGGSCTTWGKKSSCAALSPSGPDQAFALKGTKPQGTYVAETSSGTMLPGTADTGNHCDDCTTTVALPFPVTFYRETFNSATINSNGSLEFGGSSGAFSTGSSCTVPEPNLPGALLAYQGDLTTTTPGDGVFASIVGSAPHRVYVLEWRAHYFAKAQGANFEIQLHEDSPILTVVYGNTADSGESQRAGVQATSAGPSTQFSCNEAKLPNGLRIDYVPDPHVLTAAKAGNGQGTVASGPEGISCGSVCSHSFFGGASVTLTATPAAGSEFKGWSGGGCSGTGACTTTMNADQTVTATFAKIAPPPPGVPDTAIKAKINQAKHSAKFTLKATGTATGFECELIKPKVKGKKAKKPQFAACKSPKTYKNLKPGKYVFKARAVGPGGADPTPAKKAFKIKA